MNDRVRRRKSYLYVKQKPLRRNYCTQKKRLLDARENSQQGGVRLLSVFSIAVRTVTAYHARFPTYAIPLCTTLSYISLCMHCTGTTYSTRSCDACRPTTSGVCPNLLLGCCRLRRVSPRSAPAAWCPRWSCCASRSSLEPTSAMALNTDDTSSPLDSADRRANKRLDRRC